MFTIINRGVRMEKSKTKVIATRVTEPLAKLIDNYMAKDTHVTPSDFLRDAIREKLKNDVPEMYKSLFREGNHE